MTENKDKLTEGELTNWIDAGGGLNVAHSPLFDKELNAMCRTRLKEIVEWFFDEGVQQIVGDLKKTEDFDIEEALKKRPLTIEEVIQKYPEQVKKLLQQKPTVSITEIRELSARLRDTSRQSLYETKLMRWLESKGFVIEGYFNKLGTIPKI